MIACVAGGRLRPRGASGSAAKEIPPATQARTMTEIFYLSRLKEGGVGTYQKPKNRRKFPSKPKNRKKKIAQNRKTAENNHNLTTGPDDVTSRRD